MKILQKLLFTALAFTTINVTAQTVDEIVAKYTDAMGGAAKITSLTTVKMTGNMSVQGMDIPVTMTKSHLKGMRVDIEIMGTANYQILTPEKGYMFFPIQQMTEPKELDAEQVAAGQGQLDLQGLIFNYKEKGTALSFDGTEKVDATDTYKLTAKNKTGKTVTLFVDAKTNRIVKSSTKVKTPDGQEVDAETTYSDYKQNADGYWFAYTTSTPQGPITFDKIESNIKVDENIFKN